MIETDTGRALPRPYMTILTHLYEAGGSALLDAHGRLVVGPARAPIPGDTVTWLVLVAHGLVGGEGGKVILTTLGRETAAGVVAGRMKGVA